jgi:D-proline dehydrogenase
VSLKYERVLQHRPTGAHLSEIVVVGGGITGLFCAYYLNREGARVTLVEKEELGAGSVHAAGLIEPQTFYQINNWRYLQDALSFARRGVLKLRRFDFNWLLCYLRSFGYTLTRDELELIKRMSEYSVSEYRRLSEEDSDWGYTEPGLLELYEKRKSFEAALESLKTKGANHQTVEKEGYAGGVVFEDVGAVSTEQFTQRMAKELAGVPVVRAGAENVELSGRIEYGGKTLGPQAVVVTAGIECRKLGAPITAVKGLGFRLSAAGQNKSSRPIIVYERSLAMVWFDRWVKVTAGLDFDFSQEPSNFELALKHAKRFVGDASMIDVKVGFRPCSPDGLPIIAKKENLVVATGGFRLGWSFAPAMGRYAADLALGKVESYPHISKYAGRLHAGRLV